MPELWDSSFKNSVEYLIASCSCTRRYKGKHYLTCTNKCDTKERCSPIRAPLCAIFQVEKYFTPQIAPFGSMVRHYTQCIKATHLSFLELAIMKLTIRKGKLQCLGSYLHKLYYLIFFFTRCRIITFCLTSFFLTQKEIQQDRHNFG